MDKMNNTVFSEIQILLPLNSKKFKGKVLQTHIQCTIKNSISFMSVKWTFKGKMLNNQI